MPSDRTFSEIFAEHIADEGRFSETVETQNTLEPAWMAQLIGTLSISASGSNPGFHQRRYPLRKRAPHVLNEAETTAFLFLANFSPEGFHGFDQAFNQVQLKSAYRRALLQTHPDQGGNAESFQAVKKSYEILSAFVTSKM